MKPSEAAKVVAILTAAYPAARMTDATAEVYETMIGDLDFELARRAVTRLVCAAKFLPTVSEIRDAAADLSVGAGRSAVEAWGDVGMAIRRVGSYGKPKFKDPLVAECVAALGWRSLCLGESPEATDRARFCEMYAALQKRQRMQDVSEPGRLLPSVGERAPQALPANVRELVRKVGK